MTLKRRIKKMEAGLRKKGKIPPDKRVHIFFDDGSGSLRKKMEAEEAELRKKYSPDGSELIFIQSEIPEPKPRPDKNRR